MVNMSDKEIYWREFCPECNTVNWMWSGYNDVEAYKCYKCSYKWIDEDAKDWIDDVGDAFMCDGQENITSCNDISVPRKLLEDLLENTIECHNNNQYLGERGKGLLAQYQADIDRVQELLKK